MAAVDVPGTAPLPYGAQVSEQPGYLRIVGAGTYSRARSEQLIELVRREADLRRHSRVLVDLSHVREPVPNLDRFHLGEMCATVLRGLRVAIIDLTEAPDAFAETVAVNRGATMRIFTTEAEALAWLVPAEGRP